ncbi:hypothetical protein ACHAWF_018263 [Thalassiosira exigua]
MQMDPQTKIGLGRKYSLNELLDIDYPILNLPGKGEPLLQPEQIVAEDVNGHSGPKTVKAIVHYDVVKYVGPSYTTLVKLFNGGMGPTIRAKPGDTLIIELHNDLEGPLGHEGHNQYQLPNTTNIHIHGPHVSGMLPGDDIFVRVDPLEKFTYKYTFGEDHMPGTHWYHPHFYGSTSLQTAQGAAGMLVIEEQDDYNLPDEIKNMPQVQMMFQHIDLPRLNQAARNSGSLLTTWVEGDNFHITNAATDRTDLLLVNMQYMPVVTMEAKKWYRWRMVMSSAVESLVMRGSDGDCQFQLLAKDGIFLTDAPRAVSAIFLSPGNRADIAVRRDSLGTTKMIPVARGSNNFVPPPMAMPEDIPENAGDLVDQPEILTINVVQANGDDENVNESDDLEPFSVERPYYLVDLQDAPIDEEEEPFQVNFRCNPGGCNVNDIPWVNKDTFMREYALGSVQEIELRNPGFHPYHQHVNPFQIHRININEAGEKNIDAMNWYKEGDFHDTFQYPTVVQQRYGLQSILFRGIWSCIVISLRTKIAV